MDNIVIVHKVSPKYDSSKLQNPNFKDLVDVFEDRMVGWMMEWAEYLNKQEHAGFASLQIAISYFESIAIWIKGEDSKNKSALFFKHALKEVFSIELADKNKKFVDQFVSMIYKQGRCGFYHSGIAKKEIGLRDGDLFTIKEKNGEIESIWIDRYKFIKAIKRHLNNYVKKLRSPDETNLRSNFLRAWDIFHTN